MNKHSTTTLAMAITTAAVFALALLPASVFAKPVHVRQLQAISDDEYSAGTFECVTPNDNSRSEVEAHVVANPLDPDDLLATWIQDFGRAVVVGRSTDGGASWSVQAPHLLDVCSASAAGQSISGFIDPWVSFGVAHDGDPIAYLNLIRRHSDDTDDVVVLTSLGEAPTWSTPRVVRTTSDVLVDKNSITAHPTEPCRAYAVWEEGGPTETFSRLAAELATSSDCGETWSDPRTLFETTGSVPLGSLILVLPDHDTLLHVFVLHDVPSFLGERFRSPGHAPPQIMVQRSVDEGGTWSEPVVVGSAARSFPVEPDGEPILPPVIPTAGVAADGTAYVAWQDNETPGSILLTKSVDGGRSWTSPPTPVVTVEQGVFMPTLAVGPDGTVGITYYDFRGDEPSLDGSDELTTDVWFAPADQGRTDTWEELHLAGPFDLRRATRNRGLLFLGDYQGLAAFRGGFAGVFAMSSSPQVATDGKTDVFFAYLQPGSGKTLP